MIIQAKLAYSRFCPCCQRYKGAEDTYCFATTDTPSFFSPSRVSLWDALDFSRGIALVLMKLITDILGELSFPCGVSASTASPRPMLLLRPRLVESPRRRSPELLAESRSEAWLLIVRACGSPGPDAKLAAPAGDFVLAAFNSSCPLSSTECMVACLSVAGWMRCDDDDERRAAASG